jgi:molybdopterin-biosynthesis enzyme MoeA-like protein
MRQASVGALIVGDELLLGRREDRHLPHLIDTLARRGMQLAWARYAGDERDRLAEELRQTQLYDVPVLCFGGIGATPDDQTRAAAAQAFGCELVRHPEAVRLIESQFGAEAYPHRIRMAELPEDCLLIPNPVNNIPGFTLFDHHFMPGFPRMAWPMLDWVLQRYFLQPGAQLAERALRVFGVRESDLVELMETLVLRHPDAKLFSLPHLGDASSIELGFRGPADAVAKAFADLVAELEGRALSYESASAA